MLSSAASTWSRARADALLVGQPRASWRAVWVMVSMRVSMFLLALDESLLVLRGSRMPSTRELRRRQPKRMQQLAANGAKL